MEEGTDIRWQKGRWLALGVVLLGAFLIVYRVEISRRLRPISLVGAVIQQDDDPRKELPIADVEISAAHGEAAEDSKSDASGAFRLNLRWGVARGQPVTLLFRHPRYKPLELKETAGDKLYVARMTPISRPRGDEVSVANVRIRYSTKATLQVNVGSAVKTFELVNTGNVPCNAHKPCSPDGYWKAATGSFSLDAGQGNEFRNARVSCIAGPCPFTKIVSDVVSRDGRMFNVSALCWSDTTTFLLEAEVVRTMVNDIVRESFPVTFGDAMNFSLPGKAEEVSVEAEMNGAPIVFPLGPDLYLNWADCNVRVNSDHTKVYRCTLKAGYRFK